MEWLISRWVHRAGVEPQRGPRDALVREFVNWWLDTYASIGCVAGVRGDVT